MKNIDLAFLVLFIGFSFTRCSTDECKQSDWVGTFIKTNEVCDNGGVPLFEDSIAYFAETCANCISSGSTKIFEFDENCSFTIETPLFGELITTLDGTTLRVSAPLLNCSATYEKQ